MSMESLLLSLSLIACWNGYLHLKLHRESRQRRELAIVFRQYLVERRVCPTQSIV